MEACKRYRISSNSGKFLCEMTVDQDAEDRLRERGFVLESVENKAPQKTEFQRGCEYARDRILASIIGLQNGLVDKNGARYWDYQKVYDLIVEACGDMYTRYKG